MNAALTRRRDRRLAGLPGGDGLRRHRCSADSWEAPLSAQVTWLAAC